ncbi:hypothetical protein D3C72_2340120 [compost metagenome]
MRLPSRRNRVAPRSASSWRTRVVTLDCTRPSRSAARVTLPSAATVRKMSRAARSSKDAEDATILK